MQNSSMKSENLHITINNHTELQYYKKLVTIGANADVFYKKKVRSSDRTVLINLLKLLNNTRKKKNC